MAVQPQMGTAGQAGSGEKQQGLHADFLGRWDSALENCSDGLDPRERGVGWKGQEGRTYPHHGRP